MQLPEFIMAKIFYEFGGLEHPTAKIMKPVILAVTDVLKDTITIYDDTPDWDEYYTTEGVYEMLKFDELYGD